MKEFSIAQTQYILGISRPTAYYMAHRVGRLDTTVTPNGKWLIPGGAIYDIIQNELEWARMKEVRYDTVWDSIEDNT